MIRDEKKSGSVFGMNMSNHISESFLQVYGLNILCFGSENPGSWIFSTLDLEFGMEKFGSEINTLRDPQDLMRETSEQRVNSGK